MAEDSVQRRLAAILRADVVGYGRLTEAESTGSKALCAAWAIKARRDVRFSPLLSIRPKRLSCEVRTKTRIAFNNRMC